MSTRPAISNHAIYLFFPFFYDAESAVDPLVQLKNHEQATSTVDWESSDWKIDPNLHPHLRNILCIDKLTQRHKGDDQDATEDASWFRRLFHRETKHKVGRSPLSISQRSLNSLNTKDGVAFRLNISKSASRRLGMDNDYVDIGLRDVRILFFGTGLGVVLLHLKCKTDDQVLLKDLILEVNHELCHQNKDRKTRITWLNLPTSQVNDSVNDVVHHILKPIIAGEQQPEWNRVFSYTAVQHSGSFPSKEERDRYAFMLARKFTAHYDIDESAINVMSPFANICHCVGSEGGSLVIQEQSDVVFSKKFVDEQVPAVYLPMMLVCYHEFRYLLSLTQQSAFFVDFERAKQHVHDHLKERRNKLFQFGLYFRFSHASLITHHNRLYQNWRSAFSSDALLKELQQDVGLCTEYLSKEIEEKKDRRTLIFRAIFAGLATLFVAKELSEMMVSIIYNSEVHLKTAEFVAGKVSITTLDALLKHRHHFEFICAAIGSIAGIIVFSLTLFGFNIESSER